MPNYIMFFSFFVSYVTQSKQSKHEQYCFVVMPSFCSAVDQYAWCARCFRVSGFTQYYFEDLVILNRLIICFGGSWSGSRIEGTGRAVERPVVSASAIMWIKWQFSFSELGEERVDYFTDKLYLFLSFSRLIYMADYGSFVSATIWLCFFFPARIVSYCLAFASISFRSVVSRFCLSALQHCGMDAFTLRRVLWGFWRSL